MLLLPSHPGPARSPSVTGKHLPAAGKHPLEIVASMKLWQAPHHAHHPIRYNGREHLLMSMHLAITRPALPFSERVLTIDKEGTRSHAMPRLWK